MGKSGKYQPTEAELEILQILWKNQPATVKFIHEQLTEKKEVSYTTVLTQVQRMYNDKGILKRKKQGKTHLYEAVPKESEIQQTLVDKLINTAFRGSPFQMVLHALGGSSKVDKAELDALEAWITKQKLNNQKPNLD